MRNYEWEQISIPASIPSVTYLVQSHLANDTIESFLSTAEQKSGLAVLGTCCQVSSHPRARSMVTSDDFGRMAFDTGSG